MKKLKEIFPFELVGKKGRILALAVTVFMFVFVIFNRNLYLDPSLDLPKGFQLFVVSLVAAPVTGALMLIKPHVAGRYKLLANTVIFFLFPIASIQMVECFNGTYIWDWDVTLFLANYAVYLIFYLAVFLISGKYHLTTLAINIGLYIWAMANYFVTLFRTSPFVPMDILTIKTGLSVADGYVYSLSWQLVLGSILFVLIYLANRRVKNVKPEKRYGKILARVLPAAYLCLTLIPFFFTDFAADQGYKPDFWNQARGYNKTGTFFNFYLNLKYMAVQKPAGYNANNVEGYLDDYLESKGVDPDGDTCTNLLTGENDYTATDETPNIIFIMNESFSNLGALGELETNEEYLPFINSLTENTIKGYVRVPVFGAGTSNSEFEALTGDSVSFLPAGCNVYQTYLKNESPSIVSSLKTLGYSAIAYHPYYGSGWNREIVYPLMGFDDFVSIEDFIDEDILDTYKANNDVNEYEDLLKERYPDRDMLLRRFVSDSYDYQMVEDMYEERDTSQPFFLFNVTMQNHGGYAVSYRNFYQSVYATSTENTYKKANRYLSLIKESDAAFEELVEYFSNVDEPTIICMFGDHLPSIEDEFYEELFGVDSLDDLTTEQQHLRYTTPFVMWANYDIPEATINDMSVNYLSTLLEQTAGLPMTQYNKYLAALYQDIPVISTVGYEDSEGNMYLSDDTEEFDDLLHQYYCLEYNALFDKNNRQDSLFYLDE